MNRVRVALIGLGTWGEKHLEALNTIPEAEVVAVCDLDRRRLKRVASKHKVGGAYSSFEELLEREELDAVHVVTPEPFHKEPVVQAARRGIQIFVEKPMATSLEDADAMIAAAKKHKVSLMVGHVLRWDIRYAMVKQAIERGRIGEIASIFARRSVSRAEAPTFLKRSTPIMQLGIHDIDIILWYTRSRVVSAYARASRLLDFPNPDTTACTLELENGAHAVVQNSFSLPEEIPFTVGGHMEIVGSKAFIVIDVSEQGLFICDSNGWRTPDTTLIPMVGETLAGTLREEIRYFIDCVAKGTNPEIITPSESREALRVALACERSMRDGVPTRL
jgi:predicted dehydrogenase